MAFDAGAIEATLTLNRSPFTAGLLAAKRQAKELPGSVPVHSLSLLSLLLRTSRQQSPVVKRQSISSLPVLGKRATLFKPLIKNSVS
jgi:hypothetical protein